MPTSAQIEGLVRMALMLGTGYVLALGVDQATWLIVVASLASLVGAGWTLFINSRSELIKEVAKNPEVKEIVVEGKDLADSIPSDKVVPA